MKKKTEPKRRRYRNNLQMMKEDPQALISGVERILARGRGHPRLGEEVREVASIRIEPELKAYAVETWGGLSAAVDDLLRKHRERAQRRSANRLVDIQTAE